MGIAINVIGSNIQNAVINGNYDFWQRGTSFVQGSSVSYTADRFAVGAGGTGGVCTVSRQSFTLGQTQVPGNPTYFFRMDQTTGGSAPAPSAYQRVEGVSTFAGTHATLSFWAKANAPQSVSIGLIQFFGTGGSPSSPVTIPSQIITLTTSWQFFALTFSIPSISGMTLGTNGDDYLEIDFPVPASTVMTFDIARMMFNAGSSPSNFRLAANNTESELTLCQRYYEEDSASGGVQIFAGLNGQSWITIKFFARKRATPTVHFFGGSGTDTVHAFTTGADIGSVAVSPIGTFDYARCHAAGSFAGATCSFTADAEL